MRVSSEKQRRKSTPSRGKGTSKGPETGDSLALLRTDEEARVLGAEESQNRVIGVEVTRRVGHRACEASLALEGTLDLIQNMKGSCYGVKGRQGTS